MASLVDDIARAIERTPRKILHIGANRGGEARAYAAHGIEGYHVEAIPEIFEILSANCARTPNQTAIQACLDDAVRQVEFNVSSNFASSSMLDLGRHAVAYPDVTYRQTIKLHTETMDGLVARGTVPSDIDFAVLDVQGAEMKVLRGGAAFLASPALAGLQIEVSADPLYAGGATYLDICRYLEGFGFHTRFVEFNEDGWGDALFARRWWKLSPQDIPPLYRDWSPSTRGVNIAPEGTCTQSSLGRGDGRRAVMGQRGSDAAFSTQVEPQAWWQVEFPAPRAMDEVILYNVLDDEPLRTAGIRIAVSDDLSDWREIWANEYSFGGVDGRPLRVACPGTTARALRILATPGRDLGLNRVEIWDHRVGGSAAAQLAT